MLAIATRVWQTTVGVGAGNLVLGPARVGYRSALVALGAPNVHAKYAIDHIDFDEWEICEGYVDAAGILHRVTCFESSNAGDFVAFTVGEKQVYLIVDQFPLNLPLLGDAPVAPEPGLVWRTADGVFVNAEGTIRQFVLIDV